MFCYLGTGEAAKGCHLTIAIPVSLHPIDAGPSNSQPAGDFRGPDARLFEPDDPPPHGPCSGPHTWL